MVRHVSASPGAARHGRLGEVMGGTAWHGKDGKVGRGGRGMTRKG